MSGKSHGKKSTHRQRDIDFILKLGKFLADFDNRDDLRWPVANEIGEELIRISHREKTRDANAEPRP